VIYEMLLMLYSCYSYLLFVYCLVDVDYLQWAGHQHVYN